MLRKFDLIEVNVEQTKKASWKLIWNNIKDNKNFVTKQTLKKSNNKKRCSQ